MLETLGKVQRQLPAADPSCCSLLCWLPIRSETTPTMWISRFFRAVEGAHKALAAIEEQRRAVNVVALERDLARRRHLLRQVEAMRDRRAAATLRAAQNGDSTSDRELQTEVSAVVVCVALL